MATGFLSPGTSGPEALILALWLRTCIILFFALAALALAAVCRQCRFPSNVGNRSNRRRRIHLLGSKREVTRVEKEKSDSKRLRTTFTYRQRLQNASAFGEVRLRSTYHFVKRMFSSDSNADHSVPADLDIQFLNGMCSVYS